MLAHRISLAGLRAKLTAKGFTSLPVCVRCHRETQPKHWGSEGQCAECVAAVAYVDARLMEIDRRLAEIWGAGREGLAAATDPDEADALEIERYDLTAILHPENAELGPDGNPVLPERHPPMLDGATGPFLPDDRNV